MINKFPLNEDRLIFEWKPKVNNNILLWNPQITYVQDLDKPKDIRDSLKALKSTSSVGNFLRNKQTLIDMGVSNYQNWENMLQDMQIQ